MNKSYHLNWKGGKIEIDSLGCKMLPTFNLDGQKIKPLHEPDWLTDDSNDFDSLPGILQNLKGEFPCVPFGINSPVEELMHDWQSSFSEKPYLVNEPHGYCSNKNWELIDKNSNKLEFKINYPKNDLVNYLIRSIQVDDNNPNQIMCNLQVYVKEDCELPIGLHPMLRIPKNKSKIKIIPGNFKFGLNYPGLVLKDKTLGAIGKEFSNLEKVDGFDGKLKDLSQPPFEGNFEDLFQLCGVDGKMSLENYEENYKFDFVWNPNHFNSVLMWVSNKGREEYPWNSNHVTIGFEPITSAFGLSTHVSTNSNNPIVKRNVPTTIKLYKDKPLITEYSFSIHKL